jgi:hypothetical protein
MTIQEKIQQKFINTEFKGIEDMKVEVEKLLKEKVLNYDTIIDDGTDDEENDYVMRTWYRTETYMIRFFYGDINMIIGYVSVQKNSKMTIL